MKSFIIHLVALTGGALSEEVKEVYPISDFNQKVETGYFNKGGRYLGGIPKLKTFGTFSSCKEFSSENTTPTGNTCINWIIFEGNEKQSECLCSDVSCNEWTCTEYYTGVINNRCECTEDTCLSWECEGSQVETVRRSKNGETKDLIISSGSFQYLDETTWNGVISSSTRYSQEFCKSGASENVLWECTSKMYRNCSTEYNLWCSFETSMILTFVPLLIGCILLVVFFYFKMFFFFCMFSAGVFLTIFGIIVSGGVYGIYASVFVIVLVSQGFSVFACVKRNRTRTIIEPCEIV